MFIIIYTFTGTIASMFHQQQFLNLVYNEYFERNPSIYHRYYPIKIISVRFFEHKRRNVIYNRKRRANFFLYHQFLEQISPFSF